MSPADLQVFTGMMEEREREEEEMRGRGDERKRR